MKVFCFDREDLQDDRIYLANPLFPYEIPSNLPEIERVANSCILMLLQLPLRLLAKYKVFEIRVNANLATIIVKMLDNYKIIVAAQKRQAN